MEPVVPEVTEKRSLGEQLGDGNLLVRHLPQPFARSLNDPNGVLSDERLGNGRA
jgi:hypothetical protein